MVFSEKCWKTLPHPSLRNLLPQRLHASAPGGVGVPQYSQNVLLTWRLGRIPLYVSRPSQTRFPLPLRLLAESPTDPCHELLAGHRLCYPPIHNRHHHVGDVPDSLIVSDNHNGLLVLILQPLE